MLPNFFCIGAQKCGTTSIWHILNEHPDIFMAQVRETRFFFDDLIFAEGLPKYEINYFSSWAGQPVVGEKCPEYLYVPEVARRIHDTLGTDVKFIVTLRSPAQRAFSHYRHNMAMFRESRSFSETLESEAALLRKGHVVPVPYGYLGRGFYASQLKHYFELFNHDRFLYVNFETEIPTNQKRLAERIFDFLNVKRFYSGKLPFCAGHPRLEDRSVRIMNSGGNHEKCFVEIRENRFIKRRFLKWLGVKRYQNHVKTQKIYNPSETLVAFFQNTESNKPLKTSLSRQEETEINQRYFINEIKHLESLIKFDITHWIS